VEVKTSAVTNLSTTSFVLTYDPIFVEFLSAAEGTFLNKDNIPTAFSSSANPATGAVTISLSRGPQSAGVSGGGSLVTLQFKAKNKGPASFGFRNVAFSAADGKQQTILPFNTAMEIK
jgi:general secretion pathway protein D